jgi:hypothetical protein
LESNLVTNYWGPLFIDSRGGGVGVGGDGLYNVSFYRVSEQAQLLWDVPKDESLLRNKAAILRHSTKAVFYISYSAEKTKYMVMSRDQNAGQDINIQIGNKSFETVEQFKHFGTTLTNQNFIREQIKSILKSGNACCHSVQNLLSSSLLSRKRKDKDIQNYNFVCCFVWV